jgi:hypothetical protein
MTKLTGAALDQAVANVLGIKSVHNCEKWKGGERTWVGLTDEEVRQMCGSVPSMKEAVREAEAKLKEKNNA